MSLVPLWYWQPVGHALDSMNMLLAGEFNEDKPVADLAVNLASGQEYLA
jgi:hypothetical protein